MCVLALGILSVDQSLDYTRVVLPWLLTLDGVI